MIEASILGKRSYQNQIWLVKIRGHIEFCVYWGFWLLLSPVMLLSRKERAGVLISPCCLRAVRLHTAAAWTQPPPHGSDCFVPPMPYSSCTFWPLFPNGLTPVNTFKYQVPVNICMNMPRYLLNEWFKLYGRGQEAARYEGRVSSHACRGTNSMQVLARLSARKLLLRRRSRH